MDTYEVPYGLIPGEDIYPCPGLYSMGGIKPNEPATNSKWDWMLSFLVICEDKPLAGVMYYRETSSVSYTVFLLQYSGVVFAEGQTVINSIAFRGE